MDKGLREELNRAFHSTARAKIVRNQLSKVTSIDKTSVYEKVTDEFFSFTKSRAEGILRQKYYNIVSFVSNIQNLIFYVNIESTVNYTLELLAEYTGAVTMLWDLEAIDQTEAEKYFVFAGELRAELILSKFE